MNKRTALILAITLCIFGIAARAASNAVIKEVRAQLRPDFTIVVDGEVKKFRNARGETVYPILYDGTTYLPLRSTGELMGKKVYWFEDEKRIELKVPEDTTVTDADVIVPTNDNGISASGEVQTSELISVEKAKEAVLARAGLSASDVTFTKVKTEKDDGIFKYEIKFFTDDATYDVEINAKDGNILSFEKDITDKKTDPAAPKTAKFIGEEKALEIALEKAGLKSSEISYSKVKPDFDDGVYIYEVGLRAGRTEYEAEIRATDGKIISFEKDVDD